MTDSPLSEKFGDQQCEQHLQRRDLLRAGQIRMGDGLGQVEVEQEGKEQEEAGHFGGELPSVLEDQGAGVGDVGHEGTVVGIISRLP